jgi:hypothetical protein
VEYVTLAGPDHVNQGTRLLIRHPYVWQHIGESSMYKLPDSFYRAERDWLEEPEYVDPDEQEAAYDAYCDLCYEKQRNHD